LRPRFEIPEPSELIDLQVAAREVVGRVLDIAASLIYRLLHIDVAFWLNTCGETLVPRSRAVASHGAAKSERRSQINGGQNKMSCKWNTWMHDIK
jgi:hypothetical protein